MFANETQTANETDPKFEREDVPRGPRGEAKLAGGGEDNAEDGRS